MIIVYVVFFYKPDVSNRGVLRLAKTQYNFGIISKKDGLVETTFSLSNKGDKTVTIEEITTSCGCTSAEVPKKIIQPGETVPLEVTFDPDFHKEPPGKFSRTVFVQTSEGIELETKIHIEIKD